MTDMTRHYEEVKDIVQVIENKVVHVVGCGSIGTAVATTLARVGFQMFSLWDADDVEEHNVANQLFDHADIGMSKVDALREKLLRIEPKCAVMVHKDRLESENAHMIGASDVVLVCTDSMSSRSEIFDEMLQKDQAGQYIEARMGLHDGQVYAIDLSKEREWESYRDSLYTDEDSEQVACTNKTVIYTVQFVASVMARRLLQLLKGEIAYTHDLLSAKEPQVMTMKRF